MFSNDRYDFEQFECLPRRTHFTRSGQNIKGPKMPWISDETKILFIGSEAKRLFKIDRTEIKKYSDKVFKIGFAKFKNGKIVIDNMIRPLILEKAIMDKATYIIKPKLTIDDQAKSDLACLDQYHCNLYLMANITKPVIESTNYNSFGKKYPKKQTTNLLTRKFSAYYYNKKHGINRTKVSQMFNLTYHQMIDALYCKKTHERFKTILNPVPRKKPKFK